MIPNSFLIDLLAGTAAGMIYFLAAAGFTVVFGVLKVLNFAHGSFFLLAAYLIWSIVTWFQGSGAAYWVSVVAVSVAVGLLAAPIERFLLRPIYKLDQLYQILLTFGVFLLMQGIVLQVWGGVFRMIPLPEVLAGSLRLGGRDFPAYYLFIVLASVVVAIGLWLFLYRTRFGMFTRAAAMDREMSEALGLNVPWIFTAVFCLGTLLAGLAAGLGAGLKTLTIGMDLDVVMICFVVGIIGGVGSIKGALIGALLVGIVEPFTAHYLQQLSMAIPYILLIVVFLARPYGLFGRE